MTTAAARVESVRRSSELGWANKAARGLWGIVWLLLFRPSPRPLHAWRRFLLRCFGAKVHRRATVYPSVKIWAPWNLHLEEYAGLGDYVDCYNVAPVTLERGAMVSQYSYLCTAGHDIADPAHSLVTKPIVVGTGAWVAASSLVLMGVTVGEWAVVAAGSVVPKDVPPWTVVGGNPCRVIKRRELRSNSSGRVPD